MQHTHRLGALPSVPIATVVLAALLMSGCIGKEIADSASGSAFGGDAFSADMVDPSRVDKTVSHIYLGNGKIRLESTDTTSIGAIVVDPAHGTTLIVNDAAKKYIDAGMLTPLVAVVFSPIMRVLRPSGTGDPCTQWNSAINPFGAFVKRDKNDPPPQFTCKSEGAESVNGRPSQKWAVTSNDPKDGPMTIWVDDRLHLMSKSVDKDGSMEMRNIHEGPQPDSLFNPPATYTKLTISSILGGMLGGSNDKGNSGANSDFLKKLQGATSH